MKTAALFFVASLVAASAQDAYPQQLRGDRFLSVSAKAEKPEASISAKSSKAKSSKT
jgi:hypothetical protein